MLEEATPVTELQFTADSFCFVAATRTFIFCFNVIISMVTSGNRFVLDVEVVRCDYCFPLFMKLINGWF